MPVRDARRRKVQLFALALLVGLIVLDLVLYGTGTKDVRWWGVLALGGFVAAAVGLALQLRRDGGPPSGR